MLQPMRFTYPRSNLKSKGLIEAQTTRTTANRIQGTEEEELGFEQVRKVLLKKGGKE